MGCSESSFTQIGIGLKNCPSGQKIYQICNFWRLSESALTKSQEIQHFSAELKKIMKISKLNEKQKFFLVPQNQSQHQSWLLREQSKVALHV